MVDIIWKPHIIVRNYRCPVLQPLFHFSVGKSELKDLKIKCSSSIRVQEHGMYFSQQDSHCRAPFPRALVYTELASMMWLYISPAKQVFLCWGVFISRKWWWALLCSGFSSLIIVVSSAPSKASRCSGDSMMHIRTELLEFSIQMMISFVGKSLGELLSVPAQVSPDATSCAAFLFC